MKKPKVKERTFEEAFFDDMAKFESDNSVKSSLGGSTYAAGVNTASTTTVLLDIRKLLIYQTILLMRMEKKKWK